MDRLNPPLSEPESTSQSIRLTLAVPETLPSEVSEKDRGGFPAPSMPQTRGRARSFSQLATSIISPSSEKPVVDIAGLSNLTSSDSVKPDKALQETRKLLGHILHELQNRPQPPSVIETLHLGQGAQRSSSQPFIRKAARRLGSGHASRSGSLPVADGDSDNDEESDSTFSPELTFELLNKLRDVLIVAKLKSWQIFEDGANVELSEKPSFRLRRSSFNTGGRRARSFSPNRSKVSSAGLLSRCLGILSWIVLEDCRYQIRSIRISRPPNALQALTLDIWIILIHMHRDNAKVLHDIALAALPAFSTFPKSMQRRLFLFFERGLLQTMLLNLRGLQNAAPAPKAVTENQAEENQLDPPIVAIQVDEAKDDDMAISNLSENWKRWLPPNGTFSGIVSTHAPSQSMEVYYLAHVIPPLLVAILDNAELLTQDTVLSYHLKAFFSFLAEHKCDAAIDLLQIAAYRTTQSRRSAVALLLSYWPRAFGHISITKPFPLPTSSEPSEKGALNRTYRDGIHAHQHQFMPWHFNPVPSSALFEGSSFHDCHSCNRQIPDFGLLCPFCMCAVHINCYDAPGDTQLSHYPVADEPSTQRVAVHRFSYVRPEKSGRELRVTKKGQHTFRLVNIFTLSLCGACRQPLWGYVEQGYRCSKCNQYVHRSCMHEEEFGRLASCQPERDTSWITINWLDLRTSFVEFYRDIILQEEDVARCTYEELSIFWSLLWMQLQLLKYGIASGSIIVVRDRSSSVDSQIGVDNFELQHLEKLFNAYLASDRLQMSPMMGDVLQKNRYPRQFRLMLFDWPILLYVTSVARSPLFEEDDMPSESLLSATDAEAVEDFDAQPAEVVSLAHLRDVLGQQFGLHKPQAACVLLRHLRHLGFFDNADLPEGFFTSSNISAESMCHFSLPSGLDISATVEFLITAVEACFEDLDVSVNESGFLLLVRRLWPNGMFSDYALSRLIRAVVSWILSEDDNLVIILREYVAKNRNLPGVPSTNESHSWPNKYQSRSASSGSVNNGNDYVTCRKGLLEKYATRWLFAVHAQDPDVYASLIFETVSDLAMESFDVDITGDGMHENKETFSLSADKVLRSIMKICQCSIAFSTVDDLFLKWLEVFPNTLLPQKPLTTLPRLFNREAEGTARWTSAFDATIMSFDHISAPLLNPWRVVIDVAARDYDGLRKALDWLCIFASSGVDIPVNTFLQVSALARDLNVPFEDHLKLSRAIFMAIWIKSLGRQHLHRMISDLHDRHVAHVLSELEEHSNVENIYTFFRLTLSSFLLLYGCDRSRLQDLGLITSGDTEGLSRRKAAKRASLVADHDIEDIDFIDVIFRYVEEGTDELRCLITKFLVCFVTETSLLSAQELEAVILRNSFYLTRWAWKIYDMQASEVNDIRATLMLRILVVDTRRFDELLAEYFSQTNDWEKCLSAASRLFQVVLDVAKPSFSVEGRQWRSNVMQIFYRFFAASWSCNREEICLAVDAWAQTLQPAHQESMTQCFSEVLSRAPVTERLELVSFLLQLRPHFPSWKVLTWDTIIDTLMDDEFTQKTDADESAIAAHLSMYGIASIQQVEAVGSKDPDMSVLQGSLTLLSLQMIADGVSIDIFSYLKVKMQLVGLVGFPGATLVPAPSGHSFHVQFGELKTLNTSALPCLQGMMSLLDTYRLFDLAPSGMTASGAEDDTTYPVLIGSVILDVFLGLFQYLLDNVSDFPCPQIKVMLQSLAIVVYKHDVEVVPLRHLREIVRRIVKRTTSLLLKDIGSESKQVVLTIVQAYRKRWLNYASSRDLLVNQLTDIINFISSSTAVKDDFLVGQAVAVLEDIFMSHSGAFYNLSKQPLSEGAFSVLRLVMAKNARSVDTQAPLPDIIFRDTLQFLVSMHNDRGRKNTLENLKLFVEIVHHQGYTSDTLTLVGENIVSILRSASELSEEAFDPNPLLLAVVTLVQYNKAQVRGLLHHLESTMRIALVRFDVTEQTVRRLLQVTSTLFRRTESEPSATVQERNVILAAVIDVLSDGLRAKCRVTPATLRAIVNVCLFLAFFIGELRGSLGRLGNDALFYLQNSASLDLHSEHSLSTSRAASLLLINAESKDRGLLYRYLSDNVYERSSRHILSIRAWNALALESLECNSEVKPALQLFENFASFSTIYQMSLRAHSQTVGLPPDITASEINQAYIAIKLWLLLARKCADEALKGGDGTMHTALGYTSEERNALLVWNELWLPFERLVPLSETDAELGDLTPIATLVWSSIADVLLFLRLMRSTILLESASHAAILNRIKALAKGESSTSKFVRTLKSISELPPEVPLKSLVSQTTQELLAAEKLHALEARRDLGRVIPDRNRRDLRMQTG